MAQPVSNSMAQPCMAAKLCWTLRGWPCSRRPRVLLLDEPLANLDINAQQTLLTL